MLEQPENLWSGLNINCVTLPNILNKCTEDSFKQVFIIIGRKITGSALDTEIISFPSRTAYTLNFSKEERY